MRVKPTCSRCGSDRVIPDAQIVDSGWRRSLRLSVAVYQLPDALLVKGGKKDALKVSDCGDCGRVDLSVENPEELWEIYRSRER